MEENESRGTLSQGQAAYPLERISPFVSFQRNVWLLSTLLSHRFSEYSYAFHVSLNITHDAQHLDTVETETTQTFKVPQL